MAANIFYNGNEGRIRALWRIVLQVLIFLAGVVLINVVLGIVVGIILVATGGKLNDPQALMAITNHPAARVVSSVGALLVMLLSYWVAGRWLDHRSFKSFGFNFGPRWWADFGFGLLLGAVLMLFIFAVELAAGWVTITGTMQSSQPGTGFWAGILSAVVAYFCVGIYEEMLSRGYQLRNLAEGFNFKPLNPRIALLLAYVISSSVFGMLHLANPNTSLISTLNLIVAGLFLGLGYVLTGDLAISIGIHMTWNFFQGNVFGFPVSGTGNPASFIAIKQGGPELWTGGAFGPEAGLMGLAAIALGSILIVLWVRWRYGQVHLQDALAVYQTKDSVVSKPVDAQANPPLEQKYTGEQF